MRVSPFLRAAGSLRGSDRREGVRPHARGRRAACQTATQDRRLRGSARALTGARPRPLLCAPGSEPRPGRVWTRVDRGTSDPLMEDEMGRAVVKLALAVVALGWLFGGAGVTGAADKVVVAVTSPQSGPQAAWGVELIRGAELA